MNFTPLWTAALNAFSNFIIVDEHCRIAYMNKPYTEILNVQLEDVIGKPIKSVIPTTKLPEVMASGKAHIGALMTLYDHKTGKDISFVCNRIPLIEDGEVIGGVAISTFNEVGEIYNLYSEVEKMQQQNELYQQTIEQLRKQTNPLDYIIGTSQAIQQIKSTIAIFANSGLSILLTGETGVGKEVFANALHQLSSRSTSNFVKINCAAIPKDLLESELFGFTDSLFDAVDRTYLSTQSHFTCHAGVALHLRIHVAGQDGADDRQVDGRVVDLSPPAILRKTSFCASLNPTRFSNTARSMFILLRSKPVAER